MLPDIKETVSSGCLMAVTAWLLAICVAFLLAYPEMLLWNCLMPKLFGLGQITFWQMVGFNILIRLLLPEIKVTGKS